MLRTTGGPALAAALLLLAAAPAGAQTAPLDLIPADAAGGLVIKSLDAVGGKVDKFAAENNIPMQGLTSADLFGLALGGRLGVKEGFDRKGPIAAVLPNFEAAAISAFDEKNLVFLIPFSKLDFILTNFEGVQPDALKDGKIAAAGDRFLAVKGNHLVIGFAEQTVAAVLKGKPLSGELTQGQLAGIAKQDIYLHVNPAGTGEVFPSLIGFLETNIPANDEATAQQVKQMIGLAKSLRGLGAGIRIDGGVGLTLTALPKPTGEFADILAKADGKTADLSGLPAVPPLGAFAGVANQALYKPGQIAGSIRTLIEKSPEARDVLSEADEKKLTDALEAMVKAARSFKAVVYRNPNAAEAEKSGLFGMTGILEVADAEAFLAQVGDLAGVGANTIAKAAKAGGGPAPKLEFAPKAETVGDARVDVLTIVPPENAPAQATEMLGKLFGPDRLKVRLALADKTHVVYQLGSDVETLKAAIANVKAGAKGLADTKAVSGSTGRLASGRGALYLLSIANITKLAIGIQREQNPAVALDPVEALTAVAASASGDEARIEIFVPTAELKAIIQAAMQAQGGGN